MHILFATIDFVENNGPTTGLPKYIYRTAIILHSWGHEVSVVTCSNRTVEYDFFGIHVYRVRRPNIKKCGDIYIDTLNSCKCDGFIIHDTIARIIKVEKIDIIQYTSLAGIAYYNDFNIPSVMRLSSYAKMWPSFNNQLEIDAKAYIEREAAKKCDKIFGPSFLVAENFSKDINKSVDVIETPYVLEIENENRLLYEQILSGKNYILFYGSLVGYKGLELIAKTVHKILSTYKDFYFVLFGDGDNKWIDMIKKQADECKNRVLYHSAVGFDMLIPIIQNAKLVVLPSQMENFSNACVESMALGQIVLGTRGASFEQLIIDGLNGFLCEIDDEESYVTRIASALNLNEKERIDMSNEAQNTIKRLRPEVVTRQLIDYYKKIEDKYL